MSHDCRPTIVMNYFSGILAYSSNRTCSLINIGLTIMERTWAIESSVILNKQNLNNNYCINQR